MKSPSPSHTATTADSTLSSQRNFLGSSLKVAVILHHIDASSPPVIVLVNANQHGQVPAVLVDPFDQNGCIVRGTWLGDNLGNRTDGTTYVKVR